MDGSLNDFDRAFDDWRELYRATLRASHRAHAESISPSASRFKKEAATRRDLQARREIDMLLNRTNDYADSDFYPYRYLASQGFLPGYNFLRLPVRALALRRSSRDTDAIHRPRFLGLAEFGPHNTLYHEGRKHRADAIVMPADGIDSLLTSAKLCLKCGYWHDGGDSAEICENCHVSLDAANIDFPQSLLDMPTVRTTPRERISSEEEERVRSGYDIATHYRFQGEPDTAAISAGGEVLGEMTYGQSALVYRINHGWRSQGDRGRFHARRPNRAMDAANRRGIRRRSRRRAGRAAAPNRRKAFRDGRQGHFANQAQPQPVSQPGLYGYPSASPPARRSA